MAETRFSRNVKHQKSRANVYGSDIHDASAARTPSPTEGGTLVAQVKCGNVVARIYEHEGNPNFEKTVELKRQFTQDGMLVESPRFTTEDLGALRDIAKSLHAEEMSNGSMGFKRRRHEERVEEERVPKVTGRAAARLKREREPGDQGPSSNQR